MSTGKKFIRKIQALKDIHGVCVAGNIYVTDDLKRLFPYIDFFNKDYFKEVFDDAKFKVGDKVRYIGRCSSGYPKVNNKTTYKVTKVFPQVKMDELYMQYEIVDSNGSYIVIENDLAEAPSKWIISFSQGKYTEMPGVHELEYAAWNGKVGNSWKSWFIFDTQDEAIAVAKLFNKYTAKDIINIISKFENDIIGNLSKEDI